MREQSSQLARKNSIGNHSILFNIYNNELKTELNPYAIGV
jgi:hypothetical protein